MSNNTSCNSEAASSDPVDVSILNESGIEPSEVQIELEALSEGDRQNIFMEISNSENTEEMREFLDEIIKLQQQQEPATVEWVSADLVQRVKDARESGSKDDISAVKNDAKTAL